MSAKSCAEPDGAIKYALTSRLSPEGRIAVSLQLFKGRDVVHSRSLGVVERHQAVDVMFKCRMHLSRLGVEQLVAPEAPPSRLPPAQALRIRNGFIQQSELVASVLQRSAWIGKLLDRSITAFGGMQTDLP